MENLVDFVSSSITIKSKEAVNRLIKSFENRRKDCDVSKQEGPDDVYFSVPVTTSRTTTSPAQPTRFQESKKWALVLLRGLDCCSSTTIAFHYISPDMMI
ncbi:unnamed protein product [Oppiella nova]|uniref:Uncharacterized protein n=1 Tax=Oppiella nova TaxID=334625 RepID=A0A7R9LMT0_9ACAR|nr:unnamed protein product [Oppiella nova]CAG2165154.1 unnamed protein product [Oppiella nova]